MHLRTRPRGREDVERVEHELHERFVAAEREVLGQLPERLDVDVPSVEVESPRFHRVLGSNETYTAAVGTVTAKRTVYRCKGGIRGGADGASRRDCGGALAARQASSVMAQMTSGEGEALLGELGNMAPSKSSLDRLPKGLGARWEAYREAFESTMGEAMVVPDEALTTVAVSLDRVMVSMKDEGRAEECERSRARGQHTKGPAGYQESGWATRSIYDAEGERLDALAPDAAAMVDFYHAAEQLKSALDARCGENDATGRAQFHTLSHILLDDWEGVEKVIRTLAYQRKKFPRRKRIGEVLRYFRRNRHRMRYADTQVRHLPMGSGVVESVCQTLVTQRLKRSGMRWRHSGGQAILTLRSRMHRSRFGHAWPLHSKDLSQ